MVRVELSYNPYIKETRISFNENPPRINSLVEKYNDQFLQEWIDKLPSIFHDEMNGYDFDLEFYGTQMDFEELRNAFKKAGVSKDDVRLFHKGQLSDRNVKAQALDDLVAWIKSTPTQKFDFDKFTENRKDLLFGAYPFVVIGSVLKTNRLFDGIDIAIDNVDSVDELHNTNLHSTPVLFYIDRKTVGSLHHNLTTLLEHRDIHQNQLFFLINSDQKDKIIRVIQDLGINNPQVVASADDPMIYKYFELYPVSEYIHDSFAAFNQKKKEIGKLLEIQKQRSQSANEGTFKEIDTLENIISRLKQANELFTNRPNINFPDGFDKERKNLNFNISYWNNRKTKIYEFKEALALSREFNSEIQDNFRKFSRSVKRIYSKECENITAMCKKWYSTADCIDIDASSVCANLLNEYEIPDYSGKLMGIKNERYVAPKEAMLDKLFKQSHDIDANTLVLETTYPCGKWRSYIINELDAVESKMIDEAYHSIIDYYDRLTAFYTEEIQKMIHAQETTKNKVSSRLSEEARRAQSEYDWYTEFSDRLQDIERG